MASGGIRLRTVLVLLVLLLSTMPIAAGAAPCTVPDFVSGVQKVDAGVGEYVRVTFVVHATTTGTFWGAASMHAATTAVTPPYLGYAAERAAVVSVLEDANGNAINGLGGMVMYPYGVQLVSDAAFLRVDQADSATCGAAAAGSDFTLQPGTYTFTVLAGSDTPNAGAAMLPLGVEIVNVATGPTTLIDERSLSCDAKLSTMAAGVTSTALVGCARTFETEGRGYHGVFSGRFPDATHNVRWNPAAGATRTVAFFDGAIEGPGDAALEVPMYVTPVGHPFGLPIGTPGALGSDSGIFGLFADI